MDIPLLPEREEDKKVASLLSMKLRPAVDISENTELARKRIISQSSLPSNFTLAMEKKAVKILNKDQSKTLGVVRKCNKEDDSDSNKRMKGEEIDKSSEDIPSTSNCSLVGDYGSSSESDN